MIANAPPQLQPNLSQRARERQEGLAFAREWRERHRRLGTVWGIPPQPPTPVCAGCGRPM